MTPDIIQIIAALLFALAILHTFAASGLEHLARLRPAHAGLWHLLGEVEVVFGFWAMLLVLSISLVAGSKAATDYVDSRNFTEPMFVFAVMVIAAARPILQTVMRAVQALALALPLPGSLGFCLTVLTLVPLLGSLITEPAAMTLAALILSQGCFRPQLSARLRYAILGVLFVNISIGGTLSSFAAPPVLMVAGTWGWDSWHMLTTFGWKAALAVVVNALLLIGFGWRELRDLPVRPPPPGAPVVPPLLVALHLLLLAGVVVFAHHPAMFMGLFLFFLGVAHAYERHQDRLILREGLLVAFFLAGLVVLGGLQQWWLQPLLMAMDSAEVFLGATLLTALTDNAALTYLGSQVEGLSADFQYALVAGAVTGGGLTIIANAPNPAGVAILRRHFEEEAIAAHWLLLAALPPTCVAAAAFVWL